MTASAGEAKCPPVSVIDPTHWHRACRQNSKISPTLDTTNLQGTTLSLVQRKKPYVFCHRVLENFQKTISRDTTIAAQYLLGVYPTTTNIITQNSVFILDLIFQSY
jgi:hypothetical protein